MKELSLSAINARSTLPVSLTGGGSFTFSFKDDSFIVGFVKDFTILDEGVYQFFIESKNKANTSGNKDVRKTIISIIEEFFSENDSAILYICDTYDNRQSVRDRLFSIWFNSSEEKTDFTLSRAKVNVDGIYYYASLLHATVPVASKWLAAMDLKKEEMKEDGMPVLLISKYSGLSLEAIEKL